jgi:hypothetical protein
MLKAAGIAARSAALIIWRGETGNRTAESYLGRFLVMPVSDIGKTFINSLMFTSNNNNEPRPAAKPGGKA